MTLHCVHLRTMRNTHLRGTFVTSLLFVVRICVLPVFSFAIEPFRFSLTLLDIVML
jgi:hypothetical protein